MVNKGVTIQDGRLMDYILCFSVCMWFIDSVMAGPIGLKLGGIIKSLCENNLFRIFFLILENQVGRQMDYIIKRSVLCFSVCLWFIDSEMGGSIGTELDGMIEGICENNPAKYFFKFWNPRWPPNGLYTKKN